MAQNTTHAVMAQRAEAKDSLDDFPTPPWATRALLEYPLKYFAATAHSAWEPAAGRGHMARVLREKFHRVAETDIHAYGREIIESDFTLEHEHNPPVDWIITNPPFNKAEAFAARALSIAREGVALLVRTVFIESIGRYERLFSVRPPTFVAQFAERVPMVKGRLDPKASTATGYAWVIWIKNDPDSLLGRRSWSELQWIPPCRKRLEMMGDYD